MSPLLTIVVFGVAIALLSYFDDRRRLFNFQWPHGLNPEPISRKCKRYLSRFGIECTEAKWGNHYGKRQEEGPFNLVIKSEQFSDKILPIKFVCRSNEYITGERFFYDLSLDVIKRRDNPFTPVVVATSPVPSNFVNVARQYGIALIHISELEFLGNALARLKLGQFPVYEGSCLIISCALKGRPVAVALETQVEAQARAEEEQGNWRNAEILWSEHMAIKPDRWQTHISLAQCLIAQTRHDEAKKVLNKACILFFDQPPVVAAAASFAQSIHDWDEASKLWGELLQRAPTDWLGYRGKASLLAAQGLAEEADEFIIRHSARFADDATALRDVAQMSERRREWKRAGDAWQAVLLLDGSRSWEHVFLSRALREQGKFEAAYKVVSSALERFPNEPLLTSERGCFRPDTVVQ